MRTILKYPHKKYKHSYILNCYIPSSRPGLVIRGNLGSSRRNADILLYNNMVWICK